MFFCSRNDEGENCQQRKALTSHPIRIAQFHEESFFKSIKNYVKSHVFEQASVGVTNTSFINFLETCCLKNRKKLLHSRKAANDKMSPQKPNPSHAPKLLKKKQHFFPFLEIMYSREQGRFQPISETTDIAPMQQSFTKTRSCTFSQA